MTSANPWDDTSRQFIGSKLQEEPPGRETFYSVAEGQVLIEQYRLEYNDEWPHSRVAYLTPAVLGASTPTLNSPKQIPGRGMDEMEEALWPVWS
jgi:putative transposase